MVDIIPVMKPKLPSVDRLAPFLTDIDKSRFYSNFGPMACLLEERLATHFGVATAAITTVANATLGLTVTLGAQEPRPGSLCLLPGWTFIASVSAALLAGLTPYFVDVDPSTWALDPRAIEEQIARAPSPVGAVMVVAPFGQPIDYAAWDEFRSRSGLAVVIDAAAAFDTLRVGDTPAVVSLHATKILGAGEGGFVASRDTALIGAIRRRSNYGFAPDRNIVMAGFNAKMSEYHAAVALAALDTWEESRATWMTVAGAYKREFAKSNRVDLQPGFGDSWISSTCIVSIEEHVHAKVRAALTAARIDTRLWWGSGAHRYPATAAFQRAHMPVTESLAGSTLGLPLFQDLGLDQVRNIASTLIDAASS